MCDRKIYFTTLKMGRNVDISIFYRGNDITKSNYTTSSYLHFLYYIVYSNKFIVILELFQLY